MRILLVEDDRKTVTLLTQGLVEQGFTVETATSGDEALQLAVQGFDLIVLDVMLPGRDGWAVLATLRDAKNLTPVLFLTAKDAIADRVRGLELGADDYLVKPFAFAELIARIRTITRRKAVPQENFTVEDLEIDFVKLHAVRGGVVLELTPKEFALLALFVRRRGEPLTRQAIASAVWGMENDPETNVVDVHVRRLRSKADDPFALKLIHTVRGVGYVLEARD
jgi:two-component system, OmpR family, copper resistance phosphate regulon response regulator CusR